MKKILFAAVALAAMVGASGCKHGGGTTTVVTQDPYYTSWYDVYGNYCGNNRPMPGCNFYSGGQKIKDFQDPYFSQKYLEYSQNWTYTDSYGYRQNYAGYAWLSTDGILFDDFGRALNDLGEGESHDLLGEAAELESAAVTASGEALAGRFALATDRAIEIAKTLNDWAVLGKSKARTAGAVANFSTRIYGVSAAAAQAALASAERGDMRAAKAMNAQVAAYWGTNPETSQAILSAWYADEAKAIGAK